MALHILKQGTPTWGNVLGQSVGHGISALAKTKLERMKENEDIKLFTSLGIDPIEARLINKLPEKQRSSALASVLESLQKEKQSEQIGYQGQAEEPTTAMTRAPQQASSLSNILGGQSNQAQPNIGGATAGGVSMDLLPEPLRQALEEARNPRKQEQAAQQNVQYEPEQQNVQPGSNLEQQQTPKAAGKHDRLIAALRSGNKTNEVAQERARTVKQTSINNQNKPFNAMLDKAQANAEESIDAADHIINLVKTGKVASGFGGKWPLWMQNVETQDFAKYSDILAQQISGQSGVSGAFKIKFAKGQKPNLEDSTQTQLNSAYQVKEKAQKALRKIAIRDELIAENGNEQPANLASLVNKRIKELDKGGIDENAFSALPNPALWFSMHGSKPIENEDTGERMVSDGKQWKEA